MKPIKIYLLISILINFAMICCGFVFGQFDGELDNGMEMNVWIDFIGAPNKYLLQAIDSKQNKFSIKTSKTFSDDERKFIIDFNGLTSIIDSSEIGRRTDKIFFLYITLVFKENNLYYQSPNSGSKEVKLLLNIQKESNNNNKNNEKINWPDAGDLYKMSNQTRIWFGYSNQLTNNENFDSDWSNNQIIIGCVNWIHVNNKELILEMKGVNFYKQCEINESICNQYGNCKNVTIHYGLFYENYIIDCKHGLSEMTTAKHCHKDLSNRNIDLIHKYERISDNTKSIIVKLAWITQQSINQCLMEIITRLNSLIEIYSNSSNQIILAIKHDKSINWSNHILYEISSNQIHILRIEFTQSKSIFKVSNGNLIKTLILPRLGAVKLINVGRISRNNICEQQTKGFDFHFNGKQFRPLNEANVRNWIVFLVMIISVSCLALICIVKIIGKINKQKENISRSTLNIYEEPTEMSNWAPSTKKK